MSSAPKLMPLARLRVLERHGIRRFLYPLSVRLPRTASQPSRLRVADENGIPIPSEAFIRGRQAQIAFAVSLGPREKRTLLVIDTDEPVAIPDPLRREPTDGGMTLRQERVAFNLSERAGLHSVIYDGVEHLAGPLTIQRAEALEQPQSWKDLPFGDGLSFSTVARGADFKTRYEFTACKSWVRVTHTIADAPADTDTTFTLPLTPPNEIPTCDFGVGNGAYAKIGGDAVTLTADFARSPYAAWEIAHLTGDSQRLDYEGQTRHRRTFAAQAWFHWTLRTRALAVAVTHIPKDCAQLRAHLGNDGLIRISFRLGHRARDARFGVCFHFLNDIAAIAAATNPASILLPPEVIVKSR